MSGTVVLPIDTLPIWGAPSTGVPSYNMVPRVLPLRSSTNTPNPGFTLEGSAPSTPITHKESARPTIAGYAGPATSRTTSFSGRCLGGLARVWSGRLNCPSNAVGPASDANPQAAAPAVVRSVERPQASRRISSSGQG